VYYALVKRIVIKRQSILSEIEPVSLP